MYIYLQQDVLIPVSGNTPACDINTIHVNIFTTGCTVSGLYNQGLVLSRTGLD